MTTPEPTAAAWATAHETHLNGAEAAVVGCERRLDEALAARRSVRGHHPAAREQADYRIRLAEDALDTAETVRDALLSLRGLACAVAQRPEPTGAGAGRMA